MKLDKKKRLAAKVLNVGLGRIIFREGNLNEIKEAITRQDIVDLHKSGAIMIREPKGKLKVEKRKYKRGPGKVKKKVRGKKREYVAIVRKLRTYAKSLLRTGKIDNQKYRKLRGMIKSRRLKNKRHLIENLGEIKWEH